MSSATAARPQHPGAAVGVRPRRPLGTRRTVGNLAAVLAGIGLGIVVGFGITTAAGLPDSLADWLTEAGRLTGLVGAYGVLLVLLLAARIPWLEREAGQDRLVRWHRLLAPWSLVLIAAHVVLITTGYALTDGRGPVGEFVDLVTTYPWVLPALAGLILMMVAGFTSYRRARRRMSYETWWVTHLYTYLAVALAFLHQVLLGEPFLASPAARAFWIALYVLAFGALLVFRIAVPLARGWRHDLRVVAVVPEAPDAVSVWIGGRDLRRLQVLGGQFFQWRFLTRQWWWQAHPYSLSAAPDGRYLRITVKDLGDASRALARIRPGTRVLAEGPYGAFTAQRRHGDRVVLVAGGVGIAPIRSILEELPAWAQVDVLYRAPRPDAVVLHRELDAIAAARPATRIHYLVGSRRHFPLDVRGLYVLVPDIRTADVYVCGPQSLVDTVSAASRALGVPAERIHTEDFLFLPPPPPRRGPARSRS